ncbi:hypothetical protein J2W42_002237 [Rhizobium tibeticum]|nr:hypothetical protein [Rhizobium tibeticum]
MTKLSTGEDALAQNAIEHRTPDTRPMVQRPGKTSS